jgi:polar amino acid transport system substrate-binding protein
MRMRWSLLIMTLALGGAILLFRQSMSRQGSASAPTLPTPTADSAKATAAPAPDTSGTLEIAVENAAGPWSLPDGSGYANEIVVAAFHAVHTDVRLQVVPYARCKQMVVEGLVAGCFSMSRLPELEATVAFANVPLFVCRSDYFQNLSKPVPAKRAADLPKGTTVGIVLGYEYPDSLYDLVRNGQIVLDDAATEEINLRKLADGRIQATILNYDDIKTADYLLAEAGVTGKVNLAFPGGVLPSFIGFSRKHPRGLAALARFNEGVRIITASGVATQIKAAWAAKTRAALRALRAPGTPGADHR